MIRLLLAATLCIAAWTVAPDPARADDYPSRPIRVIVPFPAGGPTDAMARIVSDRLSQVLGRSIVVDNRGGGAGGSVGAKVVASADPDGYTILLTPGGSLTTGPAVHKNIGYDPLKVFAPVALLMDCPQLLSVQPSLPVKNLPELVAYAKANPGKLSFGSQGYGVGPHLLWELLKLEAGLNIVHVPYRGTAPMLAAMLTGEIQMVIDPITTSLVQLQSGKMRPLAVVGPVRTPKLPDVPTAAEQGYPKLNSPFWLGVVAPAGTPQPIIDKLNAAFRDALAQPEARARLDTLGAEIKVGTPAAFGKLMVDELTLWNGVVAAAGIKGE